MFNIKKTITISKIEILYFNNIKSVNPNNTTKPTIRQTLNNLEYNNINTKINKLQMKVNEIAKFTTNEPLAQILLSNLEESDLDEDEEE